MRETCEKLALALRLGLTAWSDALTWLARYVTTGDDDALDELHRFADTVGLELIALARVADVYRGSWASAPPELDLRPALPLAHALGESYLLFRLIDSPEVAERLPVVSMERTRELFTQSVRTWMEQHVDEVPTFATPDTP
jgi:hypothetical protein